MYYYYLDFFFNEVSSCVLEFMCCKYSSFVIWVEWALLQRIEHIVVTQVLHSIMC